MQLFPCRLAESQVFLPTSAGNDASDKPTKKMKIESLKKIGREWINGEMHRIYFNEPAQYIAGISGTKARKINAYCKLFFDVTTGKFMHQGLSDESFKSAVSKIESIA